MTLQDLFIQCAKMDVLPLLAGACDILRASGYTVETDSKHFAICTPPQPSPVALIAHCDAVWGKPPKNIVDRGGVLSVKGGGILGADDRAGVAGILACVIRGSRPQVYLTTGEETGGIGATHLAMEHRPPDTLRVMLQLDRQDSNDYVTYGCESPEFDKWIESQGYAKSIGSFSDISILAPDWGIAAANLSVGYVGQHSSREILIVPHLEHTVRRVRALIAAPPRKRIAYVERPYVRSSLGSIGTGWPDDDYAAFRGRPTYGVSQDVDDSDVIPVDKEDHEHELCPDCGDRVHWSEFDYIRSRCQLCESDRAYNRHRKGL